MVDWVVQGTGLLQEPKHPGTQRFGISANIGTRATARRSPRWRSQENFTNKRTFGDSKFIERCVKLKLASSFEPQHLKVCHLAPSLRQIPRIVLFLEDISLLILSHFTQPANNITEITPLTRIWRNESTRIALQRWWRDSLTPPPWRLPMIAIVCLSMFCLYGQGHLPINVQTAFITSRRYWTIGMHSANHRLSCWFPEPQSWN